MMPNMLQVIFFYCYKHFGKVFIHIPLTEMALSQHLVIYRPVCKMRTSHVIDSKISEFILLAIAITWKKFESNMINWSWVIEKYFIRILHPWKIATCCWPPEIYF